MGRSQAETVDVEGVPADPTGRPEQSDAPLAEQTAQSRSAGGALASWLPRQHGAWSILLVGYLLGTLAFEGRGGAVPWLVLASVLVGFVGQHSTVTALRARGTHRRAAVLAAAPLNGIAVGLMAVLIFAYGVRPLLPVVVLGSLLALVSLLVQHYHRDRTAWGELVGILGLSTVIPVASVCRTGGPYGPHIGLWLLGLLYFCGSVFHVRFLVRSWRARRGPFVKRLRAGWASAVYHPTAILAVLGLSALGWAPPWAALALLPVTVKALWAFRRGADAPPVIRTLGFIELAHSLAFAGLAILAYRLAPAP